MCRRTSVIPFLAAFLLASFASALRADEVANYLHRLGLQELLAVHLEQRLETIPSADREPIVLQLARQPVHERLLPIRAGDASQVDLEAFDAQHLVGADHAVEHPLNLRQITPTEGARHGLLHLRRSRSRCQLELDDLAEYSVVIAVTHRLYPLAMALMDSTIRARALVASAGTAPGTRTVSSQVKYRCSKASKLPGESGVPATWRSTQ